MMEGDRPPSEPTALTHQDTAGRVHMVDVGGKDETTRRAIATGTLRMRPETFQAMLDNRTPKGDPLRVAEIAGIQAAKRTADLIPLCHPLPLTSARLEVEPDAAVPGVRVTATVDVHGRTGVEMEALTAVSVALLTVYDMLKAVDRGMCIESVRLLEKSGGRSGEWRQENEAR